MVGRKRAGRGVVARAARRLRVEGSEGLRANHPRTLGLLWLGLPLLLWLEFRSRSATDIPESWQRGFALLGTAWAGFALGLLWPRGKA